MYQAIGSNVIVKVIYPTKESSIIIPQSANKFKKYDGDIQYIVESVGSKSRWRNDIRPGNRVILVRHEGKPFIEDGIEYRKVRDEWIMGRVG